MVTAFRQHIEQIISFSDAEFDFVFSHFQQKKYKKHQFLTQEGDYVNQEYFVLDGLLKAYVNRDGKLHIIQFAMENWWISDYQALLYQTRASYDIDCIEDTTVLILTAENKAKLCAASHKMEHFFRQKAVSGYVAMQKRVLSFMSNDAQSRYQQLFDLYPSLFQRIPKSMIAAYLGVSRETLSRLKLL
ncbi:Crp/Fnr family transcriptional regulator [Pedobacter punctiformis]|uniref:Crp/Fnr family transcriptional regulator n=1 Tax=Pedobacter punctiformis TaxID=3004097 RepID=A0ABT4LAX1_9SPHI|nr:Crp/Fnr family transcriptional regulator [Pedobacter sp. HCMS5-2]MCZ4245070.1 Crp/Fnr family transcriptional regulator [Pedobacter sp. HCMS5-2]